jgi:phage terminase large subunit-like protein
LLPKKNGKSTLVAALALYHLLTTADAECYIAASSREQAGIILKQARKLINSSPALGRLFDMNKREIQSLSDEGVAKVLASDVDTADGVIPTLAIVDELHRAKSSDLYGVFRDGLGPRSGQLITISTAGDDEFSPLGVMRQKAYQLPVVEIEGAYRYARSRDGAYVMHEWALEPTDDRDDMDAVKAANPASWQTKTALRRRYESPSTAPWQWARFACGVWSLGEHSWLPPGAWAGCREDDAVIPDGADVALGVDVARKQDRSAVVAAWRRPADGRVVVRAHVLAQAADLARVEEKIRDLAREFNVFEVAYDPWSFARSAEMLSDEGLPMVEFPQSPERMATASAGLYEAIVSRVIAHDGDNVLGAHVAAGSTKETERGWRLVKNPKTRKPIDALIAMALAFNRAEQAQSVYESRGVLVV